MRQGDQIRTGANATTTIDFVDGSQLVILRDSIVTFVKLQGRSDAKLASIQIDLKQGRVETRVTPRKNNNSRYDIITPTVQIGVRGTEFRVNAGDGRFDSHGSVGRQNRRRKFARQHNSADGIRYRHRKK